MIVGPNLTFDVLPYDTTPPVITLIGDNPQTVYRGTVFSDLGATVTDDFDATRTIYGSGTVDTSTVGNYTLTYATQDEVGNAATPVTRTVEVVVDPNGDEDNDGLNNTEEATLGTNPYLRDTDNDGVNDLREVGDGTDPLDADSFSSLNKGLIAYYPLDGGSANDMSGFRNNATNNGATATADRFGTTSKAVTFNGASYLVTSTISALPVESAPRTLSCWVRASRPFVTTDGSGSHVADWGMTGYARGFGLMQFLGNTWWAYSWGYDADSGVTADTEWKHLVTTYDGTEMRVFVNGQLKGTRLIDLNTQGNRFFMGVRADLSGYFAGDVDEVRIYDRPFSSSETAQLYAFEKYDGFGLEGAATKSPFDAATATSWSAGGTEWTVDTSTTHDGVDSIKAQTTDGQTTYREYTVTGPAVVDFWWKVSSEQIYDTFSYAVNGVNQESISGDVDWTYRTLTLPAGSHTIRWTYTKDGSDAVGDDAGWLDEFAVYPAEATLKVRDGETVLDGEVTVDFGDADIGSAGFTKSLTFSNEGFVPLEVELSLPEDSPFTFEGGSSNYPLLVGRGESVEVPISLSTAVRGSKTAQLTILAPDSTAPTPQIMLTGVVLGPVIGVSAAGAPVTSGQNIDLGLAPRTLQFTISNTGNVGDLLISGISVTGNFQITQQPQASILPQGSTTFTVLAQGGTSGVQSGTVTITSNDTLSETFSFSVVSKSLFSIGQGIAADSVSTSGTGGASGWDFTSIQLPSGSTGQALKTGATPNSGGSALEMVTETAGVVSWTWKVSTQENFDWLLCEVDGQEVAGISTKNGVWQTQVVQVTAGATVRWIYRKDGSGSAGEDAGYLADVEFAPMSGDQSFAEWSAAHGITDPDATLPRTVMKAMFAWLGGVDPSTGPEAGHYRSIIDGGRLRYRFAMSKTAEGTQMIQFSSDLSSWTSRGVSQRVLSEDANRVVVEATAPIGTKGFFKVVGGGNTFGSMVYVQGGTLPPASDLSGSEVAAFLIGTTEVTLKEWQEVTDWAVNNGYYDMVGVGSGNSGYHPVHSINWFDAAKWCNARSEKEGLTPVYFIDGAVYRVGEAAPTVTSGANGYRLPTEAEWEWAARGGLNSQGYVFSGSDEVNVVAWYMQNSDSSTKVVGTKSPNELGIYDMSGNLWEWCNENSNTSPPRRGGSWNNGAELCVVGVRFFIGSFSRYADLGFRVARNAED
jgi:formylglycine-generating enzyme required for sulfatase activity